MLIKHWGLASIILVPGDRAITPIQGCREHIRVPITIHIRRMNRIGTIR